MNRYQREVAEMDRQRQVLIRTLTVVGTCSLIMLALWSAGLPPTVWFERLQQLVQPQPEAAVQTPQTATVTLTSPASDRVFPGADVALGGTDSSVSPVLQALHLVSTSPGRNAREGTAALGVDIKNPQTYGAGAILANGARLTEIYADYVVLVRGDESTGLYRDGFDAKRRKQDSKLLLVGGVEPEASPVVTTREIVTDYLRPSPVYDGPIIRGFVVYPGTRSGVFSQLGLQGGDVITALNDTPFSDPAQAYEMFRQLTTGVAMTATLERQGKRERLTLDGAHIVADQERAKNAAAIPSLPMTPPST